MALIFRASASVIETWYNYTAGFDVVGTEDDADGSTGALTMTNVVRSPRAQVSATLADLVGATPASGTARYYATDHLGSTRSAWNASKVAVGTYEFTPYGGEYNHTGAALDTLAGAYTGKPWDDSAKLFHFPYRQYSPAMARWTSRDPLGMVDGPNVYGYVWDTPTNARDVDGRLAWFWIIGWVLVGDGVLGGSFAGYKICNCGDCVLRERDLALLARRAYERGRLTQEQYNNFREEQLANSPCREICSDAAMDALKEAIGNIDANPLPPYDPPFTY